MDPLVSVLIPAYNAASTLPWAIASLLAQTYQNWEALVVDDGSTDGTARLFDVLHDPRIRYFRNERNVGRSLSRQRALDAAGGAYVALLDADDWLLPDRIQVQVAAFEREPGVTLVSSGMAIVDAQQRLTGVRGFSTDSTIQTMTALGPAPVAFASSMFRRSPDLKQQFHSRHPYAEDADFLIRLLLGKRYLVLPGLAYVYAEHASASVEKMVRSHLCMALIYLRYRTKYPFRMSTLIPVSLLKAGFWAVAGRCGFANTLIRLRSRKPSPWQKAQYEVARQLVGEYVRRLGDTSKSPIGFRSS